MESVERNLELLSAAKVLVVGDIMLDRYWFGAVDRVSPEAPVPVVAVNEIEERIGGAGNVAANVCALGGTSCLLGITGHDEAGEAIAGLVRERSIQGALQTDKTISTTLKLRVIARNQQLLRADFEVRDRIVVGINNTKTKDLLFAEPNLNLQRAIEICELRGD